MNTLTAPFTSCLTLAVLRHREHIYLTVPRSSSCSWGVILPRPLLASRLRQTKSRHGSGCFGHSHQCGLVTTVLTRTEPITPTPCMTLLRSDCCSRQQLKRRWLQEGQRHMKKPRSSDGQSCGFTSQPVRDSQCP